MRAPPRLVSTSAVMMAVRLGGAGAGFVTQLLLARMLSAHELGVFFSVTSMAAIAGLISAQGYPSIAARFVARYRESGGPALLRGFVDIAEWDTGKVALLLAAALAVYGLGWSSAEAEVRWAFFISAVSIPAIASLWLFASLAGAVRAFGLSFLPDSLIRPVLLLLGLLAIVAVQGRPTLTQATLCVTLIAVLAALGQYLRIADRLPPRAEPLPRLARFARCWRAEARPLVIVTIFTALFADLEIVLATPFLPSADVAALGLCLKLALLVGFAVQVAHQVAEPDIAQAHARRDGEGQREALLRASLLPVSITLAATAAAAVAGGELLALFGPDFRRAGPALTILVASQLVRALFGPSVFVITLQGAPRANAAICAGALAFLVIANAALGHRFGLIGASWAVLLTFLVWCAMSALVLARCGGGRTDIPALLGHRSTRPSVARPPPQQDRTRPGKLAKLRKVF